jgi:signal transduction histidine kinase
MQPGEHKVDTRPPAQVPVPSRARLRGLLGGGLHKRLLLSFLLLSLVPLFGMNAVGYLRSRRIVETQVERYLHEIANLQAKRVAEHLEQQLAYLRAVGTGNRFLQAAAERRVPGARPLMGEVADPAAVSQYLRNQLDEAERRFTDMALFSLDGTLLGSSAVDPKSYRRAGPASDPVTVLREDGDPTPPVLRYTVPVMSQRGDVVAYLSASVSTGSAQAFLGFPGQEEDNIRSFILDQAGRPIFISHFHAGASYSKPLNNPLLELPPGWNGRYVNDDGVEVIGTALSLPGSPWVFLAEVPAATALGSLRSLQRLSILLGGVFFILVVAVGWLLASGIVAPVRRLVNATRRVAAGDLQTRVPAGGRDEIGEMSVAFNEMARDLAENEARIQELHEREIARAEQLATVGELASGLAHEIKNPVIGISNGMDLVLRRVGPDPHLKPIAEEMKKQLDRIEQAVRDLLAFARPRSLDLAPNDVNEIVRRATTLVQPAASKTGVTVRVDLVPELPRLNLDGELIRQAVVNLLVNAVQHSEPDSVVSVSTRYAREQVEIDIKDTGSGIEEKVLQQLFKPFFTTRHSGTGLGLSITRGIVERHGGSLSVETAVGVGSVFTIVLSPQPPGAGEAAENGRS